MPILGKRKMRRNFVIVAIVQKMLRGHAGKKEKQHLVDDYTGPANGAMSKLTSVIFKHTQWI